MIIIGVILTNLTKSSMTIEQAVQKAVIYDWRPKGFPLEEESEEILVKIASEQQMEEDDVLFPVFFINREYPEEGYYYSTDVPYIVLDPLFWKSLGKAMGWKENHEECFCITDSVNTAIHLDCKKWIHKWCGLIYHINDGGTIESFFETL